MRVARSIHNKLLCNLPTDYETGGILGGINGVVTHAELDIGRRNESICCYVPDTERLNVCIEEWANDGIELYGLFHSHLHCLESLSSADIEYATAILRAVGNDIDFLYFPIVIPNIRIVSYVGMLENGGIAVLNDCVEIVSDDI